MDVIKYVYELCTIVTSPDCHGLSDRQQPDYLANSLFNEYIRHITGSSWGEPTVTCGFQ